MFCLRQLRGAVGNAREGRTDFEHAVVFFDESELLESAYEDVHSQADAHHFRDDLLRHAGQRASTRAAGFQVGTRTTCLAPSRSDVPTERAYVSVAFSRWAVEANRGRIYACNLVGEGRVSTVDLPRIPILSVSIG